MSDWTNDQAFYRVSLKALIRDNENRILMVSEKNGDLSLPGGGFDHDEEIHESLQRELLEEIGLTSNFRETLIATEKRHLPHKDAWLLWMVYEIKYDELDFSIGVDGDSTQWVEESSLNDKTPANKMIRSVLRSIQ